MLYIGLVAGVVAGNVAAHAAGMDAFRAYLATITLMIPALIGARMLYVVFHWPFYQHNPRRIWNRNDGGAAQYGGLVPVLLLSVPLVHALHLSLGAFWDVTTFTLLVGMIFGRVGCLLNGCCAGRPSSTWLSVYLPNHMGVWERRIPTPCLEATWAAVLLVSAIATWRWLPFPGALFLLVTTAYCCGRLLLESWREPTPGANRFNIQHGISVVLIMASVTTLMACWPR
jgi:phosphatidylglycerol:prolipoprotein diacylglycerol transferase